MTRKDYVALAEAMKLTRTLTAGRVVPSDEFMRIAVNAVADVLAADNPRFDRPRFIFACYGEVIS